MARIVPVVLAVAVWIYGIIHCALTSKDAMPGRVPKWGWMALNILLPVIGAIIWFAALYAARADVDADAAQSGPIAPDDNPEFLAHLEREAKFREWERRQNAPEDQRKPENPAQSVTPSEEEILRDLEQDFRSGDDGEATPA